jgi:hypothetical protein
MAKLNQSKSQHGLRDPGRLERPTLQQPSGSQKEKKAQT